MVESIGSGDGVLGEVVCDEIKTSRSGQYREFVLGISDANLAGDTLLATAALAKDDPGELIRFREDTGTNQEMAYGVAWSSSQGDYLIQVQTEATSEIDIRLKVVRVTLA